MEINTRRICLGDILWASEWNVIEKYLKKIGLK